AGRLLHLVVELERVTVRRREPKRPPLPSLLAGVDPPRTLEARGELVEVLGPLGAPSDVVDAGGVAGGGGQRGGLEVAPRAQIRGVARMLDLLEPDDVAPETERGVKIGRHEADVAELRNLHVD